MQDDMTEIESTITSTKAVEQPHKSRAENNVMPEATTSGQRPRLEKYGLSIAGLFRSSGGSKTKNPK